MLPAFLFNGLCVLPAGCRLVTGVLLSLSSLFFFRPPIFYRLRRLFKLPKILSHPTNNSPQAGRKFLRVGQTPTKNSQSNRSLTTKNRQRTTKNSQSITAFTTKNAHAGFCASLFSRASGTHPQHHLHVVGQGEGEERG